MNNLPQHIAIIMDGNGRWAKRRGLKRTEGHKEGVNSVKSVIKVCLQQNIKYLTLFSFSRENWQRPKVEVDFLFSILEQVLSAEVDSLIQQGVRLNFIGDRASLPPSLIFLIEQAEQRTQQQSKLHVNLAVNYSGRWDIVQAALKLHKNISAVVNAPFEELEQQFVKGLSLAKLPELDFFIRTGNEIRVSNFLLWDLAYAELYFSELMWPEFREQAMQAALQEYSLRERRFGKVTDVYVE